MDCFARPDGAGARQCADDAVTVLPVPVSTATAAAAWRRNLNDRVTAHQPELPSAGVRPGLPAATATDSLRVETTTGPGRRD